MVRRAVLRHSWVLASFMVSFLSAGALANEVTLDFRLGADAWKKTLSSAERFTEAEMKSVLSQGLEEMQACLNSALDRAGASDLKLKLILGDISKLSPQEEAGISQSPESLEPDRDGEGNPILGTPGNQTNRHAIVVSEKVQGTHVAPVFTREVREFRDSQEFRKMLSFVEDYSRLVNEISESKRRGACGECDRKLQRATAEAEGYSQRMTRLLVKSNLTYIEARKFVFHLRKEGIPEENSTFRTLAHELMHSWGGLDDRYLEKALGDNLMKNFKCVLDLGQVQAVRAYRSKGNPGAAGK